MRKLKKCLFGTIAVTMALAVSGCLNIAIGIGLHDDGSGQVVYDVKIEPTMLNMAAAAEGMTPSEACDMAWAETPEAEIMASAEAPDFGEVNFAYGLDENGNCASTTSITWSADQLEEALVWLAADTQTVIARTDSGWKFELDAQAFQEETFAVMASDPNTVPDVDESSETELELGDPAADMLLASLQLSFSVALPGEIIAHNADTIVDGAAVWNIDPMNTQDDGHLFYLETDTSIAPTSEADAAIPSDSTSVNGTVAETTSPETVAVNNESASTTEGTSAAEKNAAETGKDQAGTDGNNDDEDGQGVPWLVWVGAAMVVGVALGFLVPANRKKK